MLEEKLLAQDSAENRVEYAGGSVTYRKFGPAESLQQKILVLPGFTEDSFTMADFAEALTNDSRREVIVPDQPEFSRGREASRGLAIVDRHAQAYLEVIKSEGLSNEPLAVVAHSMGAPILVRMAELAKEQGITALDTEQGSKSVFLAPAGSNNKERLILSRNSLAKRFVFGFWPRDNKEIKQFDPAKKLSKRSQANAFKSIRKTLAEARFLGKKETIYSKLGDVGLKPFVLGFADDKLEPQGINTAAMRAVETVGDESLEGWSTAVGKPVEINSWLDEPRHAGHNDHARHPERVADIILEYFDRDASTRLTDLKEANANLTPQEKQSPVEVVRRPKPLQ